MRKAKKNSNFCADNFLVYLVKSGEGKSEKLIFMLTIETYSCITGKYM